MLYVSCFHGCPISYGNTQSKFYHSVDTSKTKSVFDFLLNPKKTQKKTEKDFYTGLENSLWGSRTLKTTKALLFAK